MKNKIGIVLLLIMVGFYSLSAKAIVEAVTSNLFKGVIYLNNQKIDFKQEAYTINGTVYVPLRQLATLLGGLVSYNAKNQTVYIEQPKQFNSIKSVVSEYDQASMKLQVFSGKLEYAFGEPLEIWANLSNMTDKSIELVHNPSLILFSIVDEEGVEGNMIVGLSAHTTLFHPDDVLFTSINQGVIAMYNGNKNSSNDDDENFVSLLGIAVQPATLPKGKYTLKVSARYTIKEEIGSEDIISPNDKLEQLEVTIPLIIN